MERLVVKDARYHLPRALYVFPAHQKMNMSLNHQAPIPYWNIQVQRARVEGRNLDLPCMSNQSGLRGCWFLSGAVWLTFNVGSSLVESICL